MEVIIMGNGPAFNFGFVNIYIKSIPEGWMVKMVFNKADIRLEIVPDKDHIWKPKKEDWQNIRFFTHNRAKVIRTPAGWLLFLCKEISRITRERGFSRQVLGDTKYIHDPDNIFNPELIAKRNNTGQQSEPEKEVEDVEKQSCRDLEQDRFTEKSEPLHGYRLTVKTFSRCGEDWSRIRAETLEELKDILKNKYKKSTFTLISTSLASDCTAIHNQRRLIPLDELNDEDCQWLAERSGYDVRHLE
jgi:hypothetical protein